MLMLLSIASTQALPAHLLPLWEPTYDMRRSTVVQPCNWSGTMDSSWLAQWGVVSMDWSNGRAQWANQRPMQCDEMLLEQIKGIKQASGNTTKVFTYRNIVKALPWFSAVREKIVDPAYSGWFLKFHGDITHDNYTNSPCQENQGCSALYHDELSTPQDTGKPNIQKDGWCNSTCDCGGVPCGEYLFDHRNSSLGDWLLETFLFGDTGMGSPFVDGFFLDDLWAPHGGWGCQLTSSFGGPTEMNDNCIQDMRLTGDVVDHVTAAWHQNFVTAKAAAVAAGGFEWHLFAGYNAPLQGGPQQCEAFFREACLPHSTAYDSALMVGFTPDLDPEKPGRAPHWKEDLATFLLIRGPFAWIGHGFSTCSLGDEPVGGVGQLYERPVALNVDYGTPLGLCSETQSGVFTRKWSKASVMFNCSSGTGTIDVVNGE